MLVLINVTVLSFLMAPIMFENKDAMLRSLPMKMWLPFGNLESHYWFYYFFQAFHFVTAGLINVGYDLLYAAFILTTCHKFDLLVKRFQNLSKIIKLCKSYQSKCKIQENIISKAVQHHELIFE